MILDSIKNMIQAPQSPIIVGGVGELGIQVAQPSEVGSSSLSYLLQIIIAVATVAKLYIDWQKQKEVNKGKALDLEKEKFEGGDKTPQP